MIPPSYENITNVNIMVTATVIIVLIFNSIVIFIVISLSSKRTNNRTPIPLSEIKYLFLKNSLS